MIILYNKETPIGRIEKNEGDWYCKESWSLEIFESKYPLVDVEDYC